MASILLEIILAQTYLGVRYWVLCCFSSAQVIYTKTLVIIQGPSRMTRHAEAYQRLYQRSIIEFFWGFCLRHCSQYYTGLYMVIKRKAGFLKIMSDLWPFGDIKSCFYITVSQRSVTYWKLRLFSLNLCGYGFLHAEGNTILCKHDLKSASGAIHMEVSWPG